MTTIYDWSLSAAGNANADDIINWAEGQPPSSVNNSARSMMQRMREFISDLGGIIVAEGSDNSVALATASPITAYSNGIIIRFRAIHSNTDSVMVNLNMLGFKPVFKTAYTGIMQLTGGEIQRDGIYELIYNLKLNGGTGGWILLSPTPPQFIPTGMIAPFAAPTPPAGWLVCNGAEVSRSRYPDLFAVIDTIHGVGDGWTTFNVPDYRGMFLRGWDARRGIDTGRTFASRQESENKSHTHTGATDVQGKHRHRITSVFAQDRSWAYTAGRNTMPQYMDIDTEDAGEHQHNFTTNPSGSNESRPVNMSVIYIIKA